MKKYKILIGILCICLITPLFQYMNANALRDRTLDQMITDSFVLISDDGSVKTIDLEDVASEKKEISVADKYEVVNNVGGEVVETFESEEAAIAAITELEEETEEELTVQPFNLQAIETGIVYINTYDVSEYVMAQTGQKGYISGAFGRDGAYIGEFNGLIRAKVAGVIADFNPEDVDVQAYSANTPTSYYMEVDGHLHHFFLYSSSNTYSKVRVGYDLDYLQSDVKYYSYDGHYFYDTYEKMVADYKTGVFTNAINAANPYYNYYQFLSHRSTNTISAADIDSITSNYFGSVAGYESSKLHQAGQYFISSQNKYTVNGLLMYGVAVNESNWGKSSYALNRNNLFGHSAYDENPNSADYYDSVEECIDTHAFRFISRGFLDYNDWRHFGPHLGDKESGINVKYASDPYWGEKAACRAYYLTDIAVDYGKEKIGIINGAFASCNLYKEADPKSKVITALVNLSNVPVLILDEVEVNGVKWYKIASDTPLTENRNKHDYSLVYNPELSYLYIEANKVMVVWEGKEDQPVTDGTITIPSLEAGHKVVVKDTSLITESKTTIADIKAIDATAIIKKGDTEITDATASVGTGYTVAINNKTYTIVKLGDVNGDGLINSGDLFATQKYLLNKSELSEAAKNAADANRDGKINSGDLFAIQKHLIKKTEFSL